MGRAVCINCCMAEYFQGEAAGEMRLVSVNKFVRRLSVLCFEQS